MFDGNGQIVIAAGTIQDSVKKKIFNFSFRLNNLYIYLHYNINSLLEANKSCMGIIKYKIKLNYHINDRIHLFI